MPTNAAPAPLRWLMPSVTDLLFVAILATLVFTPLSVKLLNDAGTGWHIRTGQLIVATHQVPHFDSFSSQINKPWFAWEWLYDIVLGSLERWCGLNGAVWFTAIVIATVVAWTFRLLIVSGTHLLNALVLTLLATGGSMIHFLARPHEHIERRRPHLDSRCRDSQPRDWNRRPTSGSTQRHDAPERSPRSRRQARPG